MDDVEQLASLIGVPSGRRDARDWPVIEESLGLRLPTDYKELVERLPDGTFRGGLRVNRPGDHRGAPWDFLGFYAHRLDDLRTWRDGGHAAVPHPIFPEPGGLLPWASGARLEPICWLTTGDEPDGWPVTVTDAEFGTWRTFPGPAAQFLLAAVEGRLEDWPAIRAPDGAPAFERSQP